MDSLQGNSSSSQLKERDVSSSSLRSKIPVFIIFIVLGSVLVALPAYYYFESLKLKAGIKQEQVTQTASRPTPTGIPPFESVIPTLDRIANCAGGVFPEAVAVPELTHNNNQPFGLIVEKGSSESLSVKVQEVFGGEIVDVNLSGVNEIIFREVFDRERYAKGETTSFSQVNIKNGQPYGIKDVHPYLAVGTHIWYFEDDIIRKVLMIYCDAV